MRGTMVLALIPTLAAWLHAAEPDAISNNEQVVSDELKEIQEDPSILKRRIWLDTEWNHFKGGSSEVIPTSAALWSWPVSTNQDWGVRIKVPLELHVAGDTAGDVDKQGLGDIKLAAGTAYRFSESWRAGGGLEMRFPSATRDDLGNDVWRLQELGAVAWDATRWLTINPSTEYNQSVAEESGGAPQHYLEMYFPVSFILPRHWSVTPRYRAKIDFENDNRWTNYAKLAVAKQLDDPPIGFSISIEKPFQGGGTKEFQVNFITTYYFHLAEHRTAEAR